MWGNCDMLNVSNPRKVANASWKSPAETPLKLHMWRHCVSLKKWIEFSVEGLKLGLESLDSVQSVERQAAMQRLRSVCRSALRVIGRVAGR